MTINNGKKVSVLIPCRNEVNNIETCIRSIYNFNSPVGGFEVLVIDGMSHDGTRAILERLMNEYSNLILVDNPRKTSPHAMNLGISHANGEYIVRTDVRCVYPTSYLLDLLELSKQTSAENVGGILEAIGESYTQKSIAAAYKSPIAVGSALGSRNTTVREVDDVYGGCFKKKYLIKIGSYDDEMVRNQDDELSFRIRKAGGRIIQSGKIRVQYFPRKHFVQLFKQFYQYGYWKVVVIRKHPHQSSWRHIAPSMMVIGFIALGVSSLINFLPSTYFLSYSTVYILFLLLEALRITIKEDVKLCLGVALAILLMHVGYGTGFISYFIHKACGVKWKWAETLSR